MRKQTTLRIVCAALVTLLLTGYANAFSTSNYATTSKLASGKWVKITIAENGVYELTYDELKAMGFNSPENVRVYGHGGNRISETLTGDAIDDLKPVPVVRSNNKICFYGNGPVSFTLSDYSSAAHYTRVFNPYSQVACYFLTEESSTETAPQAATVVNLTSGYTDVSTSLNYFWHENELISISSSGKEMLGEDFGSKDLLVDYSLPQIADSTIVVQTALGANVSVLSYATAYIHSGGATDTTSYTSGSSRIYKPSSSYVYYNVASPYGKVKLKHPAEKGQFQPVLTFSSSDYTISMARLDYFIITYTRNNVIIDGDDGQILMGYAKLDGKQRIQLPGTNDDLVVFNLADKYAPTLVPTTAYSDDSGSGRAFIAPNTTAAVYVAFDPTQTLKKISAYETVANQNLHGMATPEMLIITDSYFHSEAQRIADLHAAVDGLKVSVVDQDQVFNEFSSGTRDGMAYRLLCKMFYDRNPETFKYLLLFGPGSIDNREILGEHPHTLLTYQSDNSNYEDYSFTTDDFFGFLNDNSGSNIASDKLSIGVGRMPCADLDEAASDVDKLVEYYASPDYGSWRNNTTVSSDSPDNGLYMFQGEGYGNLIDNELGTNMHVNKVHNSMYPRSTDETANSVERKTATTAKQHMKDLLKDGQYFFTYVGHAGAISMTKYNKMWTNSDVSSTRYQHFPIMSTACCNVARYDSDVRGIAESMFHKRDGGAIALLTSSRMVYATGNDMLNTYFIKSLFSFAANDSMPTLGTAYRQAKLSFTSANTNKLSFMLMGDPGMKVNYPKPYFNITSINGTDMTDTSAVAQLSPLMQFTITAKVVDENGNLNTDFEGDATATLYDKEDVFTTLTFTVGSTKTPRDIYFEREKLAEIQGRVSGGVFTGTMVVPQSPLASNENVLLRVYAHQDDSHEMVNGLTEQITMLPYDESLAISDDSAPVIETMFLNDEQSFSEGAVVASSATLYITATDDYALNVQNNSVDNGMTLVLDGGKTSYSDITRYVTMTDGAKALSIEYPLSGLSDGLHTLTYTVYDMAGNRATRTISFLVGKDYNATVTADVMPAFQDGEVNFDFGSDLTTSPEVTLRVTDATGKLVWINKSTSATATWNMKDMSGNRVPAGLYRYFATFNDGSSYGGSPIYKLVVLEPLKSNRTE